MARSELNFTVQVLAAVMLLLVGWATSQAPGDADELCITGALADIRPVYPDNLEPLMDSRDYINLISPSTVFPPVWQVLDIDGFDDGEHIVTWTQQAFLPCRQRPFVCGFEAATGDNPDQNNWLITQHISRNVSGVLLREAKVEVEYEFLSCIASPDNRCAATFDIWTYETSVIDPGAANNTDNYVQIHRIAPINGSGAVRESAIRDIDFRSNSETGFYLGIQDINSCIFIHRVLVFYYICPATTQNLIVHPETMAPPTGTPAELVNAECVENAHPFIGSNPVLNPALTCSPGGLWTVFIGCVCNPGFLAEENGTACTAGIPERLELYFINNTPRVEGNTITAEFETNRPGVGIQCHLTRSDVPRQNCTSSSFIQTNLPPARYTVRAVARDQATGDRTIVRSSVQVSVDETFCTVHLVNRLVTIRGNNAIVEFGSTGIAAEFLCVLDRRRIFECQSPVLLTGLASGRHHFKVIPTNCGRQFRPRVVQFIIN